MIWDHLKNLSRYNFPQTERIIEFIAKHDCLSLPNEPIEMDGQNLFVRVMEYVPKPASENRFETHVRYADLQYVVSGIELMQVTPLKALTVLGDYDSKGDYQFYKPHEDHATDVIVNAGEFTIFYPGEAHRPSCLYQNNKGIVKKLVFKIKIP